MRVKRKKLIVIKLFIAVVLIVTLTSCQNNIIIEEEETPKGAPIQDIDNEDFIFSFISDEFSTIISEQV